MGRFKHSLIFLFVVVVAFPLFPKEINAPGETFDNSDNQNKEN